MASWTTPKTWAVGDILTAADMNTYVRDNTTFLHGNNLHKTTTKTVNGGVDGTAETDLFAGEFTIAAGSMGTVGVAAIRAAGEILNSSGATQAAPRFKLKLGGTVLIDTGATPGMWTSNASRWGLVLDAWIQNVATNSQVCAIELTLAANTMTAAIAGFATGTGTYRGQELSGVAAEGLAVGSGTGAVDTTLDRLLEFSVILPAASGSVEVELRSAFVEILP